MARLQEEPYMLRHKGPVVAGLKEAADHLYAPRNH